ncbi:TPA: helix-turn-helix transcriptional regulator [Pseudomonas aeruginosa]|nr:helix-turn-helix transcriptional regulator [Pseudomonas aeruginosa]MBX6702495.1 helix-turn-helix transcriptional regulator [Pseudomonas aeruginosa]HBO4001770.1 helix-turn-helix transcriptional regulator [Pseudomonas aeruginosa]HCF0014821.1 helix-turn-helix transcriptional regulator [Pseudomonas aeruginosa]HCF1894761.1 helix-turn-helix transcriptional regulator [Pseudomonas aeruginosa]
MGLTQKELADAAGISLVQIARYETGRSTPRLSGALKLARALKMDAFDLMPELKKTTIEVEIELSDDELARFEAEAEELGITTEELLRKPAGVEEDEFSEELPDTQGRKISLNISAEHEAKIHEFAKKEGVSFDAAVQLILAQGLKDRLDADSTILAKLEQDIPGAYEKLVELLRKQ